MTEQNTMRRNIPAINEVDGFNPADFVRELKGDDGESSAYLDVKYRLLWFRLDHPNGKIVPEIISVDNTSAVVCCKLYLDRSDPADQFIAMSYAQRFANAEKFGDRFLEIAETAAMGRVLAAAGYGTQFCSSGDMLSGIIADAPLELRDLSEVEDTEGTHPSQQGTVIPAPVPVAPQPAAPIVPQAPSRPEPKTVEELLAVMTLDEAKSVMVDFGRYSGTTLGQIAMIKPADLEWFVRNYSGRNIAVKAGATLLLNMAQKKAG